MVGRKTSQRCDNCRKRKVKCDLVRPSCSPCQKAGWTCPGYDDNAIFHEHVVTPAKGPVRGSCQRQHPAALPIGRVRIHGVPLSSTDALRSELVFKGRNGQLSARFIVIPEYRMMEHVPQRLGKDRALDDAVRLICTSEPAGALRAYGLTLKSLQHSIDNGPSTEAVGAATLLQMHDFFQNSFYQTWAVHASGVIGMLKARGPEAVKTGFEKCLLQAQVGNITLAALREREACFLELPAWNDKLKSLGRHEKEGKEVYSWEISLIATGVHIPGLISRFEAVQRGKQESYDGDGSTHPNQAVISELRTIRDDLNVALTRAPNAVPSRDQLSGNRIQPALLLATNFYLVLIDYMLGSVEAIFPCIPTYDGVGPALNDADLQSYFDRLRTMRKLYHQLSLLDTVALQSTVDMLRLTLHRVLHAVNDAWTQKNPMQGIIDEVHMLLASPSNRVNGQRHLILPVDRYGA